MTMTLLMARFTFREALHKRVVHGVVILTVAFLALYALGNYLAFRYLGEAPISNRDESFHLLALQFTLLGMNVVSMIGALLAVFLSVGTISSEIDGGTLQAIIPKPLHRRDVVIGKWLGFACMLSVYVFLLCMALGLIIRIFGGVWIDKMVQSSLPLVLQSILLLSISILGTTCLSTVTNGVLTFGLYAISLLSGFMEQLGTLIDNAGMINAGIAVSLVIPSDSMAKLSAAMLQEGATFFERAGPFMVNSRPSIWMVVYTALYSMAAVAIAVRVFSARDL